MTRQPYNHRLRLDRALEHLQSLEAEVQRWLGTNPYNIIQEYHAERSQHTFRAEPKGLPPAKINLILSDCLHELRSALDNLVYDLAVAHNGGNPLSSNVEEVLMFPISEHKGKFPKWRIRDIPPDAQTIIQNLQPYNLTGDDYRFNPLWQLNELSRIDKHRLLHVTLFGRQGAGFGTRSNVSIFGDTGAGLGAAYPLGSGVGDGAELLTYSGTPINPSEKMSVYFNFSFGIAFGGGSPANAQPVIEVLKGFRQYILYTVRPALAPYLTHIPVVHVGQYCLLEDKDL